MDAQAMEFADSAFDSAAATFVFCSVPDPALGLREARRALKPGGRLYLMEHVLTKKQPLRWIMQRLNGVVSTIGGANINRDTVANVEAAGFAILEVRDLWTDIVKLIVAEKSMPLDCLPLHRSAGLERAICFDNLSDSDAQSFP